jgi:hypothetical protein
MAHPFTFHTSLTSGFARGLLAEMATARAGPWKPIENSTRAVLRGPAEAPNLRAPLPDCRPGRNRWPPNAMHAGRDAAMLVAPVHEALMRLGAL